MKVFGNRNSGGMVWPGRTCYAGCVLLELKGLCIDFRDRLWCYAGFGRKVRVVWPWGCRHVKILAGTRNRVDLF